MRSSLTSFLVLASIGLCVRAISPIAQTKPVARLSASDKAGNNYRVYEPDGEVVGLLVLLPSYGGNMDSFTPSGLTPSRLPDYLAKHRVLTIVPTPSPASTLWYGDGPLVALDAVIAEVLGLYKIPANRVLLGGFSAGGTGAIRYAQFCAEKRSRSGVEPAAVFAVDAPLDLERLWRAQELCMERRSKRSNLAEARLILDHLRAEMGGSPVEVPEQYRRQSPFLAFAEDGGNARLLANIPLRLYTEPDVDWWLENRGVDYYGMNAIDHAAMINQLRILGNDRAELIETTGKGYRPDGSRHPHSWSIVDETDLANWLIANLAHDETTR